ncbi:sensor histidine kinase [Actinomadura sp. 9N407]|uniref:sensor histidine kinase n=1 Tax=Actinomadura sp. 9N407 TaxID=3375154 RepID=UPI0037A405B3
MAASRMSLRTRLVLTVVGLLALALSIAGGATFAALFEWEADSGDRLLSSVGREAATLTRERGAGRPGATALRLPPPDSDLSRLWHAGSLHGGFPSFLQIRDSGGRVVQTVAFAETPALPADLRPGRITPDNPDGERFTRIEAKVRPGDGSEGPFGRGVPDWRIRTAWLPDGGGTLVMAMRTTEQDELLGRTLGSQVTVSVAVLAAVGLLARHAVRRATRPLEEIAAAAGAIGDGDLARRVPEQGPRSEVGRLGAALNTMLGQIESAFRERAESEERLRRFVADASHELRTPLATVRGYAELFRRGAADRPADLAKAMSRIESEAERMGRLVDEMLLLARLDQGRPLEREPVDLADLAASAVADARAVEPTWPLTLEPGGPVIVRGDAGRLRQVLGNLLANARLHTPPGTAATVRVAEEDGAVVLEVADEGPGLAGDERDRVFERFYRADPARTRDQGGAGLGLSIVAAVAEAHGGRAEVRSGPGEGARFRVTFPPFTDGDTP